MMKWMLWYLSKYGYNIELTLLVSVPDDAIKLQKDMKNLVMVDKNGMKMKVKKCTIISYNKSTFHKKK